MRLRRYILLTVELEFLFLLVVIEKDRGARCLCNLHLNACVIEVDGRHRTLSGGVREDAQ